MELGRNLINSLPAELFIAILQDVFDQYANDRRPSWRYMKHALNDERTSTLLDKPPNAIFFNYVMGCCKYWYMTGLPILFQTAVLQYPQLSSYRPFNFDTKSLLHTKSLIVQATAVDFASHRGLHRALTHVQLNKILPLQLCTKLTSFSLVYTVHQSPTRWHHSLSASSVKVLLGSLPQSVVNLDLDIPGVGVLSPKMGPGGTLFYPRKPDESYHLCSTLGPMLTRLKSLRLRASFMCEDLFACIAHADGCRKRQSEHHVEKHVEKLDLPLETMILRLDPWNAAHGTVHCKQVSAIGAPTWQHRYPSRMRNELATELRKYVIGDTVLQHIKVCKVVEFKTVTVDAPISLDEFLGTVHEAESMSVLKPMPRNFLQEQCFSIWDVLLEAFQYRDYLRHCRTTSDFGGGNRTWETQEIDWDSKIDAEKTWRWI
ncbi:hypothetical protein K504DRAFT_500502 [Pleomassaria siparia CBS 279.74]|uniref:Uncharacterized protein n=1 Tax=Pleomassaria siparia CBS 279.74 TaxID=1314801 RepID=A0A6G1KGB0_9PLEO|nr:hypothetical protein K504DRAFT_500502 [Pleomassaria siparia CBS 279.74]